MSNGFWVKIICIVVYFESISPTKNLDHKDPFEALYGYNPLVSHIRVFWRKEFSHVPKEDRRKLDSKAIKCIFIGYFDNHKAYKMFDPSTHKVFARRDGVFHDDAEEIQKDNGHDVWHLPIESSKEEEEEEVDLVEDQSTGETISSKSVSRKDGTPKSSEPLRRSSRKVKTPIRYKDYALMSHVMNIVEPLNFEQANKHKEWRDAMKEEYDSIMKNETCELIELPKNKVSIGSKWLFKFKFNANGSIDKYKSRLVANG